IASSDSRAVLPGDYTFTVTDAGTHTFSVALLSAGNQSITVTDTANARDTGSELGIAINPAATSGFVVTGFPSPASAGSSHGFKIMAVDPYGNVTPGYTGTVHFTSSDPQASL